MDDSHVTTVPRASTAFATDDGNTAADFRHPQGCQGWVYPSIAQSRQDPRIEEQRVCRSRFRPGCVLPRDLGRTSSLRPCPGAAPSKRTITRLRRADGAAPRCASGAVSQSPSDYVNIPRQSRGLYSVSPSKGLGEARLDKTKAPAPADPWGRGRSLDRRVRTLRQVHRGVRHEP